MDDDYRPRQQRRPANMTRRQRAALRRDQAHPRPGGITTQCGCRYTRTAGQWWHLTPCRSHQLALFPLTDEHMKQIGAAP